MTTWIEDQLKVAGFQINRWAGGLSGLLGNCLEGLGKAFLWPAKTGQRPGPRIASSRVAGLAKQKSCLAISRPDALDSRGREELK